MTRTKQNTTRACHLCGEPTRGRCMTCREAICGGCSQKANRRVCPDCEPPAGIPAGCTKAHLAEERRRARRFTVRTRYGWGWEITIPVPGGHAVHGPFETQDMAERMAAEMNAGRSFSEAIKRQRLVRRDGRWYDA